MGPRPRKAHKPCENKPLICAFLPKEHVRTQTKTLHNAGPEGVDDHVGSFDELADNLVPAPGLSTNSVRFTESERSRHAGAHVPSGQ